MEDSYKRREQQLRDEHALMTSHQQDKDRAVLQEKEDMIAGHKRKCDTLVQHHASELERMKQLHKKVKNFFLAYLLTETGVQDLLLSFTVYIMVFK